MHNQKKIIFSLLIAGIITIFATKRNNHNKNKMMKLISWNVNGLRACEGKGFSDIIQTVGCRLLLPAGDKDAGGTVGLAV